MFALLIEHVIIDVYSAVERAIMSNPLWTAKRSANAECVELCESAMCRQTTTVIIEDNFKTDEIQQPGARLSASQRGCRFDLRQLCKQRWAKKPRKCPVELDEGRTLIRTTL